MGDVAGEKKKNSTKSSGLSWLMPYNLRLDYSIYYAIACTLTYILDLNVSMRISPEPSSSMILQMFTYPLAHRDIQHLSGNLCIIMMLSPAVQNLLLSKSSAKIYNPISLKGNSKTLMKNIEFLEKQQQSELIKMVFISTTLGGMVATTLTGGVQGSSGIIMLLSLYYLLHSLRLVDLSGSKLKRLERQNIIQKRMKSLIIFALFSVRIFYEYQYDPARFPILVPFHVNSGVNFGLDPKSPAAALANTALNDGDILSQQDKYNAMLDRDRGEFQEVYRAGERFKLRYNEINSEYCHMFTAIFGAVIYPRIFNSDVSTLPRRKQQNGAEVDENPGLFSGLRGLWGDAKGDEESSDEDSEDDNRATRNKGLFGLFSPTARAKSKPKNEGIKGKNSFDRSKPGAPNMRPKPKPKTFQRNTLSAVADSTDFHANIPKEKRRGANFKRGRPADQQSLSSTDDND